MSASNAAREVTGPTNAWTSEEAAVAEIEVIEETAVEETSTVPEEGK